jgi:outer membrane lipopolysaccharide assembly protein LptE/RlpB
MGRVHKSGKVNEYALNFVHHFQIVLTNQKFIHFQIVLTKQMLVSSGMHI